MEGLRRWLGQEGNLHSKWLAIFAVAVLALFLWPTSNPVTEAAKKSLLIIFGFVWFFQFGRLVQTWRTRVVLVDYPQGSQVEKPQYASESVPSWDHSANIAPSPTSSVRLQAPAMSYASGSDIKAFSSIDEGRENGWSFGDAEVIFEGVQVPSVAELKGVVYEYYGLLSTNAVVPADVRVFGRLAYRQRKVG